MSQVREKIVIYIRCVSHGEMRIITDAWSNSGRSYCWILTFNFLRHMSHIRKNKNYRNLRRQWKFQYRYAFSPGTMNILYYTCIIKSMIHASTTSLEYKSSRQDGDNNPEPSNTLYATANKINDALSLSFSLAGARAGFDRNYTPWEPIRICAASRTLCAVSFAFRE